MVLMRVARALGVEVHELLTHEEHPVTEAALEVTRVMERFNEHDAKFLLSEFRHIAAYMRAIREHQA